MITPLDDLKKLLDQIANCTEEEKKELETVGYDVNELQSGLHQFICIQERNKQFRYAVEQAPRGVREAICEIAYALKLDSGPTYKSSCTSALMALLGVDTYHHTDAGIAYELAKFDD